MNGAVAAPAGRPAPGRMRWALMFGNFVMGCGVMVTAGTLNDLSDSLQVSVAAAGQLIAVAAATMALAAPLLAGWVAAFDRRRLLAFALLWYGAGHGLSALMPDYASLWPMRAVTMLAAAVFTPQAGAAIGHLAPPHERGRAITFIFLGWSLASVIGLPLSAWIGDTLGWRAAFAAIGGLSIAAAVWVYRVMPDGVRPAALSLRAWKAVFTSPVLMAIVLVTALSGAGQFTIFSYITPYYKQVLGVGTAQISMLLVCFGTFGLIGNVVLTRVIDRVGANAAVATSLALIAVSLLLWPLGVGVLSTALILVPWGLGGFASNSTQQARLGMAAPALAPALLALNTSAIYVGQAVGAGSGGWLIARHGFGPLHWFGFGWLVVALGLSLWAGRRTVALA